ncbi:AAA family ATPase [Archangium sp.]|uniref:AAA family ATPase n=1 Tax=Archangium sp. TaxID=1872627 RepID=UPI002ED9020C
MFLDAAEQIAEVAGFDVFRLGLVVHEASRVVVALSASLERSRPETPALPFLRAGPLCAVQSLRPLAELGSLLVKLESNELGAPFMDPPVHFKKTESPSPQPIHDAWRYTRSDKREHGSGTYAEAYLADLRLLPPRDLLDAQIAADSNYAHASLIRLIKAYTGMEAGGWNSSRLLLVAPWPVSELQAAREAGRLRISVVGLEGLDTSRFILNIEGTQTDWKLDASSLRWKATPGANPHGTTYRTTVDAEGTQPQAVNLYLSRAPAISLRESVPREQSPFVPPPIVHPPAAPLQETVAGMRLTALRIGSFRLLRSAELRFEPPFTVIVGPNQSGKSSVLDALQLLSDAARGDLTDALTRRRGGLGSILSRGEAGAPVHLEAELEADTGQRLRYLLECGPVGSYDFTITREELAEQSQDAWVPILIRTGAQARVAGAPLAPPNGRETLLAQLGSVTLPAVRQVQSSLAAIMVHPYFRTGAAWADPEAVSMRQPSRLEPGTRLARTGNNLSAALFSMREERPEDWTDFVEVARLAFPSLKALRLPAVSRGMVQLRWDDTSGNDFDAAELSDGTLAFLATLCALFQPGSALIAVEEPEQHLHPEAMMRLIGAARSLSVRQPILFTTQSDTLIGLLDDAPECIVVAKREGDASRLLRPEADALKEWLRSFSLREMRSELEGWGPTP